MKTYTTEFQLMSQCKAGLADKSCMLIMVHAFHCTLYVMYKMQVFALLTKVIEHLIYPLAAQSDLAGLLATNYSSHLYRPT